MRLLLCVSAVALGMSRSSLGSACLSSHRSAGFGSLLDHLLSVVELCCPLDLTPCQSVGMAKEAAEAVPAAKQLFERASDILGYDLLAVCAEGALGGGCLLLPVCLLGVTLRGEPFVVKVADAVLGQPSLLATSTAEPHHPA